MIGRHALSARGLLIALLLFAGATTIGCDISPVPNPTAGAEPEYSEEAGEETGFETLGEGDETGLVPPGEDTGFSGSGLEDGNDTNDGGLNGDTGSGEETAGEETGDEQTGGGGEETGEDEEESGEEDECDEDALETEDTEGEDCPDEESSEDPLDE
jgi:hypothetical protein